LGEVKIPRFDILENISWQALRSSGVIPKMSSAFNSCRDSEGGAMGNSWVARGNFTFDSFRAAN
jgi:hypothetical protein